MGIDSFEVGIQAKILAYTAFSVTVIFWSQGTDPFNLPKLEILVVGAFSLLGSKFSSVSDIRFATKHIFEVVLASLVILGLLASFFLSGAPKWQMIYGVYSRNTGLLCYLSFLVVFLFSANLKNRSELIFVVKYFVFASVVAISVSLIEISGVNIQGVDENFNMSLISTFGNSNFISACYIFHIYNWIKNWPMAEMCHRQFSGYLIFTDPKITIKARASSFILWVSTNLRFLFIK